MNTLGDRVRRSPLFWPLPPAHALVPAAVVLLLVLVSTWERTSWRALDWIHFSSQIGAEARLPVAVTAGACALVAARFARPRVVFAQSWQPRAGAAAPARQAAVIVGWCLVAFLVGLLPLLVAVAAQGAGVPDPIVVAGALAGFVALSLLGYLAGALIGSLLAVPVAVAVVFLLASLPLVADAWGALSLQVPFPPSLGMRENPYSALYRLGFFLLLAVAVGWTSLWALRRPRETSPVHAVAVLVALVALIPPHARPLPPLSYASTPEEVCSEESGVRYCVHEGHTSELDDLVELATPVFEAHGRPGPPSQVRDLSLAEGDSEVLESPDDVLWLRIFPGWDPVQEAPATAAEWLTPDVHRCGSDGVGSLDDGAGPAERRAAVLYGFSAWLSSQPYDGDAHGDPLFSDVDPEEIQGWLLRDRERLESCSVEPEELPW